MRLSIVLAAAAALLAAPSVARACSCGGDPPVMWPTMDATGVPTNTRLWVGTSWLYELTTPRLRKAGEAVDLAFTISTIETSNGPLDVYTPGAPLAPKTAYELLACDSETCDAPQLRFTTGPDADLDPPPVPIEVDRSGDAGGSGLNSCGKYKSATVSLDAEGLLVAEIDGGMLDPLTLSGTTTVATLDAGIVVGRGGCFMHWPTSEDSAPVRYGAFDLAGNFSGWTEPDTLTIGRGCGCRSDAPGAPAVLLLAVAALALRRRRRQ